MEDIQTLALQTFSNNLEFLSTHDKNLFDKINILQNAIENGQFQPNYALEYRDEGYFDVKNLHDDSWLYGINSNEYAKQKTDEITYDKNDGNISLSYRFRWSKAMIEDCEKMSPLNSPLVLRAPVEGLLDELGGRGVFMKRFYKFAFLGLGLGVHVQSIHEKIQAQSYLLVEDNLELFYLSLFVCKYYEIAKSASLFFCIMNDGFKKVFDKFLNINWYRNDFLKFSLFNNTHASKITQIQGFSAARSNLIYPASLLLRKNIRLSEVLQNGYNFLDISKIHSSSPLKGKKVIFLAAGPSLGTYMEWLKKYRDRFFVIAVFMISAKLRDANIKPDIYIHMDENEAPIQNTLAKFQELSYFKDITFILSASVPMEMFEKLCKKDDIFLVEDRTRYKVGHGFLDFYSVGEAGYMLSVLLGADELYLLGLDLALGKSGQTHVDGHSSSSEKLDLEKQDEVEAVGSLTKSIYSIDGNRGGKVPTTPLFGASVNAVNYFTAKYLGEQKVYNLSDGAYFQRTIPMETKDVVFDDESLNIKDEMDGFLREISTDTFSDDEKNYLQIRHQEMRKKIKAIKKFGEKRYKNVKEFSDAFTELNHTLVTAPNENVIENASIFSAYLENVSSFVSEYLNTKEADLSPKNLEKVRNTFHTQLKKLLFGFGLMDFDYLDGSKYFIPTGIYKKAQNITDNFEMRYSQYSYGKELCFEMMLKNDFEGKLFANIEAIPLEEKKGVGFLATLANLQDEIFIEYIKKNFTDIKVLYFEKYQKDIARELFKNLSEVEYKEILCVADIVNSSRVYLSNNIYEKSPLDTDILWALRRETMEIFSVGSWLELQDVLLDEHEANNQEYLDNMEKDIFGDVEDGLFFQRFYKQTLKKYNLPAFEITKDIDIPQMISKVVIANTLKSADFAKYILEVDNKYL